MQTPVADTDRLSLASLGDSADLSCSFISVSLPRLTLVSVNYISIRAGTHAVTVDLFQRRWRLRPNVVTGNALADKKNLSDKFPEQFIPITLNLRIQ